LGNSDQVEDGDLGALTERFAQRLKRSSRRVATVNTDAGQYGFRRSQAART
jgi:hypothetical protein